MSHVKCLKKSSCKILFSGLILTTLVNKVNCSGIELNSHSCNCSFLLKKLAENAFNLTLEKQALNILCEASISIGIQFTEILH